MTALLPALAGANLIYGLGMLELGITFCFEQFVIDNEIARMIKRAVQGIDVNDEALAVDIITKVGAGGDFLMQEHTMRHMRQVQSQPRLIDRKMRNAWLEAGGKNLTEVAHEEALSILTAYKPEPLSEDVSNKLRSIVEEAEEEFGIHKPAALH
ncbi:MAG TPA: hypothetical protein GX507_00160 [Clostridia bacterium]|nr:hypothetical protein [Clostridia bacterium]